MGSDPWNSAEGRYDTPSSSVPQSRHAIRTTPKRRVGGASEALPADAPVGRPVVRESALERRLRSAELDGVKAIGADTIRSRIDEAIAAIVDKGHGRATSIYLIDADLLALRDALGCTPDEYRDLRIASGATSKVYSKRGSVPVRRPKAAKAAAALSLFEPSG